MSQPTAPDQHDDSAPHQRPRRIVRRAMNSEAAAGPSFRVKVTWRFTPEDRSRLQRLARLLFDPDTDRESTRSSHP
jgi:hypothetical protein